MPEVNDETLAVGSWQSAVGSWQLAVGLGLFQQQRSTELCCKEVIRTFS